MKGLTKGALVAAAAGAAAAIAERRRLSAGRASRAASEPLGPPPSPETDPFGAIDAARERLRREAGDDRGPG
jgi:hypothetical protein